MAKKKRKRLNSIKCECGYCNKKGMIDIYGTCRLCGKILDQKAKYRYEMRKRLYKFPGTKRRFDVWVCVWLKLDSLLFILVLLGLWLITYTDTRKILVIIVWLLLFYCLFVKFIYLLKLILEIDMFKYEIIVDSETKTDIYFFGRKSIKYYFALLKCKFFRKSFDVVEVEITKFWWGEYYEANSCWHKRKRK